MLQKDDIRKIVKKHLPRSFVDGIERIADGQVKHTYKVAIDQKPYAFQVWAEPDYGLSSNDDFGLYSGTIENQIAINKFLKTIGIRTPELVFSDLFDGRDCILMEYVEGDTSCSNPAFVQRAGQVFGKLNAQTRAYPGLLTGPRQDYSCAKACLNALQLELQTGTEYNSLLRESSEEIRNRAKKAYGAIEPRDWYSLIHGDVKPNHLIWTKKNDLCILDTEGCKYQDFEFELSDFVMPFSFTNSDLFMAAYVAENPRKPDPSRMSLYKLYRYVCTISYCSECLAKSIHVEEDEEQLSMVLDSCLKGIREDFFK